MQKEYGKTAQELVNYEYNKEDPLNFFNHLGEDYRLYYQDRLAAKLKSIKEALNGYKQQT